LYTVMDQTTYTKIVTAKRLDIKISNMVTYVVLLGSGMTAL
jgi:hypothetical protein